MKKLNLFVDAHVLNDKYQGSRTYLLGIYKELLGMTDNIHFYFGVNDTSQLPEYLYDRDKVSCIKYFSRNKYVRLAFNIPMLILKYKIDIAHYQYVLPLIRLSKEILTIHDVLFIDYPDLFPYWYRRKNRFLFRNGARRATHVLTVSEYSRDRIAEHFSIDKEKISITPNAISDNYFTCSNEEINIQNKYGLTDFLLFVGRIEPRKNHIMLLKAYNELGLYKRGFQLVFIGTRSISSPDLEQYFNNLSSEIRNSVKFLENVPDNEMPLFYKNCRLFVYPSIAEGFGIPPLEAYASGASVICANTTAMSDFKFLRGRLFNPASLDELKEKIIEFIDFQQEKSVNDIDLVKQFYNWKVPAEVLLKLLRPD